MKMLRAGSKPGTAHHVHRTIRNALNEAKRRGHLSQNPALLAKAPKLADDETEPYTVIQVGVPPALAAERRNGPRWVVALALGLRQGETLGLKWEHVDLDTGLIRIRRNRLRPTNRDGMRGNSAAGRPVYGPIPAGPRRHRPDEIPRGPPRVVGLPEPLIVLLRVHREQPGSRAQDRSPALARRRMGVRQARWPTAQPEHRLPRMESGDRGSGATRAALA